MSDEIYWCMAAVYLCVHQGRIDCREISKNCCNLDDKTIKYRYIGSSLLTGIKSSSIKQESCAIAKITARCVLYK